MESSPVCQGTASSPWECRSPWEGASPASSQGGFLGSEAKGSRNRPQPSATSISSAFLDMSSHSHLGHTTKQFHEEGGTSHPRQTAGAIPLSLVPRKTGCLGDLMPITGWLCVLAHSRVSNTLRNSSWRSSPLPTNRANPTTALPPSPPSLVSSSLPNYSSWLPNQWQHAYVRSIGLKVMHISHRLPASVWSHPTPAGSGMAGMR